MFETCSTYEKEKMRKGIWCEIPKEGYPFEHLDFNGNRILKYIFKMEREDLGWINLIKPTGHVMHQQFNIQQLYVLPTLYLYVLCISENKQRLVPLTS